VLTERLLGAQPAKWSVRLALGQRNRASDTRQRSNSTLKLAFSYDNPKGREMNLPSRPKFCWLGCSLFLSPFFNRKSNSALTWPYAILRRKSSTLCTYLDIGMANPPSHTIRHCCPFILLAAASTTSRVEGTCYNIPPTRPRLATLLEQHGYHACDNRLSRGRICIGNEGTKIEQRLVLTLSL
jgi:hypothetical protein